MLRSVPRAVLPLSLATVGFLCLGACIIVKETQIPSEESQTRLRHRVENLERQIATGPSGLAPGQAIVARVGEVQAISSPGALLMLRLDAGHGLEAGKEVAILGAQGFKALARIEEVFDAGSASARQLGEMVFGRETRVGDVVVPMARLD